MLQNTIIVLKIPCRTPVSTVEVAFIAFASKGAESISGKIYSHACFIYLSVELIIQHIIG